MCSESLILPHFPTILNLPQSSSKHERYKHEIIKIKKMMFHLLNETLKKSIKKTIENKEDFFCVQEEKGCFVKYIYFC